MSNRQGLLGLGVILAVALLASNIGAIGGLAPDRRAEVARFGLKALLAGPLVNLSNAAIAGIVAG